MAPTTPSSKSPGKRRDASPELGYDGALSVSSSLTAGPAKKVKPEQPSAATAQGAGTPGSSQAQGPARVTRATRSSLGGGSLGTGASSNGEGELMSRPFPLAAFNSRILTRAHPTLCRRLAPACLPPKRYGDSPDAQSARWFEASPAGGERPRRVAASRPWRIDLQGGSRAEDRWATG